MYTRHFFFFLDWFWIDGFMGQFTIFTTPLRALCLLPHHSRSRTPLSPPSDTVTCPHHIPPTTIDPILTPTILPHTQQADYRIP